VQVNPVSQLDLKSGKWNPAEALAMNAIGKVHLARRAAISTPRAEPLDRRLHPDRSDTNNTVAGGMITAKRADLGGLNANDGRVILSLPADLAEQILATELLASRRDEVESRRITNAAARDLFDGIDG
jgi:sulfate adenylyltransferase subunit 1